MIRRALAAFAGFVGAAAILAGVALAVVLTPVSASEAGAGAGSVLLVALALAAAKLYGAGGDDETVAPAPWTESGALVAGTPEETADPADVTGADFAALVDEACERAREAETVEDGFEVVRPPLSEALGRVLAAGGTDETTDEALATGSWTDDRVAAAVVDDRVERPPGSLRERVRAWLFPERVVRRETARAVAAVAEAADAELPPVAGQRAPRTVPTLAPSIGSLQRAADGTLQRASRPVGGAVGGDTAGAEAPTSGDRSGDHSAADDSGDEPADASEQSGDGSQNGAAEGVDDLVAEVWDDA